MHRRSVATAATACGCLGQSSSGKPASGCLFCKQSFRGRNLNCDDQHQKLIVNEIISSSYSSCKQQKSPANYQTTSQCPECNGQPNKTEVDKSRLLSSASSQSSPLAKAISNHYNASSYKLSKFLQHSLSLGATFQPNNERLICAKVATPLPSTKSSPSSSTPPMATKDTNSCCEIKNNSDNLVVAASKYNDTVDVPLAIDKDTDSGYAWVILAVVFVINASTFGTARAYGQIFDKLAREDEQTRAQAALPFTIMGAVENMAGPLSGYMLVRSGSWRLTVCIGSLLITLGHLLAAILDSQAGQLLSMGLMCGFGLSLVTISFFQVNNAYFVRYRSTAFGLGLTGAAFGTLYISPLCQYFLDNYGTSACYFMLSLILLPNVPLSLLLKPKKTAPYQTSIQSNSNTVQSTDSTVKILSTFVENGVVGDQANGSRSCSANSAPSTPTSSVVNASGDIPTISGELSQRDKPTRGIWISIKLVISNPIFHLIWPTQLLFCWFNFVFGMIIVDFGKDRGLTSIHVAQLVPIWAFGQLVGRMVLGSLVDLKYITYKSFTVICFASIGLTTWALNDIKADGDYLNLLVSLLVFILSMFIALLYILFNGLVVNYVEASLQSLSIGISSFAGSFFLLPRATVIGYYRDTTGNYDTMLTMFTYTSLIAAFLWLVIPSICDRLKRLWLEAMKRHTNKALENLQPYSCWILNSKSCGHRPIDNKKQEPRKCASLCSAHQQCQVCLVSHRKC